LDGIVVKRRRHWRGWLNGGYIRNDAEADGAANWHYPVHWLGGCAAVIIMVGFYRLGTS